MEHDEPILEKLTDVSVTFSEKPMVIFQLPLFNKFHWLELFPHIPKFILAGFNYFLKPNLILIFRDSLFTLFLLQMTSSLTLN